MARRTYRVSRHGLTACPGCGTHIKVDTTDWRETVCPFCDAALLAKAPAVGRVPGRAGLLAAGLLSLSLAACDDDGVVDDMGPDVAVDAAMGDMDPEPEPDMGAVEPDMAPEVDAAPDMQLAPDFGPQPEYGKPVDDFGVEPDMAPEADMQLAPDFGPQPEYGGPPPDFDMGPQPQQDMELPAPLYGIPPMEPDQGPPSTQDAEVDQGEPVPVPLYGVPPQEEEA